MKEYRKPCSVSLDGERALAPAAIAAAAEFVAGLSVTQAALVGAAAGLALSGDRDYKGNQQALPKCIVE